jgi:D-glycero-D-manno-heptose 1,7-bisphosphate phosphatase
MKAVFLDRDGTINKLMTNRENPKHVAPWYFSEFEYIDGVHEAIKLFRGCGFALHVVTNQPDVDDGYMTEDTMNQIHLSIIKDLGVESVQAARTRGADNYKPNPGMITKKLDSHKISRHESWMIGDTWRDVVAGHKAGVNTIYLGAVYTPPEEFKDIMPTHMADNLKEAALIIQQIEGGR